MLDSITAALVKASKAMKRKLHTRPNKPATAPIAAACPDVPPTPELLLRRPHIASEGHIEQAGQRAQRVIRTEARAREWWRWGWITWNQRAALEEWERLEDSCMWGSLRSNMVMTVGGPSSGFGCVSDAVAFNRRRSDKVGRALIERLGTDGRSAAYTVFEWMASSERPDFAEEFGTGRNAGRDLAKQRIARVADALIVVMR